MASQRILFLHESPGPQPIRWFSARLLSACVFAYAGPAVDSLSDSLALVIAALNDSIARVKSMAILPIGTVVASILTPAKFSELMGADSVYWKLADSSTASTEFFAATGVSNIPDLRGAFLRGINAGRATTTGDPAGERTVGSYQADELKSHSHTVLQHYVGGANQQYGVFASLNELNISRATSAYGGDETRPRNVAVYWYIKVK